jgi:hypothetical protein
MKNLLNNFRDNWEYIVLPIVFFGIGSFIIVVMLDAVAQF